jgi:DNA polymerase III alpha subunit
MENLKHPTLTPVTDPSVASSNRTSLGRRILYFDGTIEVKAELAEEFSLKHPGVRFFVDRITSEIDQFNRFVEESKRISKKGEVAEPDLEWKIPERYKTLNVTERVWNALADQVDLDDDEISARIDRVRFEMSLLKRLELMDFLRTLCFIVDTLSERGIPWGVGRGSSVSSYVLYLIGVHDVDSVMYELDFKDFIKI